MREHGLGLHPHLSTVTYLTDAGGPTAVAAQRRPDEEAGVSLKPRALLLSYPSAGKHFAFDGRFLHGAPASSGGGGKDIRVTFLVNIWLGYTPAGVRRFEASPTDAWSSTSTAAAAARKPRVEPIISPVTSPFPAEMDTEGLLVDAPRRCYPLLFIGDDVDVELSLPALSTNLSEHSNHLGKTFALGSSLDGDLPVRFEENLCANRDNFA